MLPFYEQSHWVDAINSPPRLTLYLYFKRSTLRCSSFGGQCHNPAPHSVFQSKAFPTLTPHGTYLSHTWHQFSQLGKYNAQSLGHSVLPRSCSSACSPPQNSRAGKLSRWNPNSWLIQQRIWKITAFTIYSNFKQSCAGTEWSTSASVSYSNNNSAFLSAASASEHKVCGKLSHLVCTSQGNMQWVPTGMAFFSMETRWAWMLAGSCLVVAQNVGGTVAPQFATSPIKAGCACWKMQVKARRVWGNGRDKET